MATGIKDKVAIIGMGCSKFGERWDMGAEELMVEAFEECIADAGIEKKDIGAAWLGTCFESINVGGAPCPLSLTLRLPFIPVTRVENFCATGTEAFRGAVYAVASGAYDICLALGVEKLKDTGYGGLPQFRGVRLRHPDLAVVSQHHRPRVVCPAGLGLRRQVQCVGPGYQGAMAHVSAKSHANGVKNPKAHLRKAVTKEQIMAAPIIAHPLGLFDCCGVSDGAACAIVTTPEIAKKMGKKNRFGQGPSAGVEQRRRDGLQRLGWGSFHDHHQGQHHGLQGSRHHRSPQGDFHDGGPRLFLHHRAGHHGRSAHLRAGPGLAGCPGRRLRYRREVPCQVDGGLKCFGHPIGASGLRMIYEMYLQLHGRAGSGSWKTRLRSDP
jgi:acetyl-CoA C-acetyltransferase